MEESTKKEETEPEKHEAPQRTVNRFKRPSLIGQPIQTRTDEEMRRFNPVLHPASRIRAAIERFMFFLLVVNTFFVPYQMMISLRATKWDDVTVKLCVARVGRSKQVFSSEKVAIVLDIFFTLEILSNFFKGYHDEATSAPNFFCRVNDSIAWLRLKTFQNGDYVDDLKTIAKRYIAKHLFLDLFTTFTFWIVNLSIDHSVSKNNPQVLVVQHDDSQDS